MPDYIVKRDGSLETWNPKKITNSVKKAMEATKILDDIDKKSDYVSRMVLFGINGDNKIQQEQVQDLVEKSLMKNGYYDVAKSFILYREKRREIREQKKLQIDIRKTIDSYIGGKDWRINENANMDYSYQGLVLNISGEIESKYCLNKYPEYVRDAHINGFFHIHDLSQGLTGYCSGWSLYDLILEGFNLEGCCSSGPAKHFDTVLSQMINFIGTLQNEWAGAQAFSSVDTLLAPFVHYDNLTYKQIKQSIQRFIYNLNTTSRWGGQCPFSNLTFDLTVPKFYKHMPVIIGGKAKDKTYKEFTKEMEMVNRAFLDVMKNGDYDGRIFSFPIPTYNITKEFDWDSEIAKSILEMTAKYGTPYFQNFISSDIDPESVRSFCPLVGDTEVIVKRTTGENSINSYINEASIRKISSVYNSKKFDFEVLFNGKWYKSKLNKQSGETVKIICDNGVEVEVGLNHLQPIIRENSKDVIKCENLIEGDYIPFSIYGYDGNEYGSYDLGFIIGAYLGDGSIDDTHVVFSLSENKNLAFYKIKDFFVNNLGCYIYTFRKDESICLKIKGNHAVSLIEKFVEGKYAKEKSLKNICFKMSNYFREGILEGLQQTDGNRNNHTSRIYTSSNRLKEQLIQLYSSLGKRSSICIDEKRIKKLPSGYTSDTVIYSIREVKRGYKPNHFFDGEYQWVRVNKIIYSNEIKDLYCFEVDNNEHLFQLANGLVTHNCRLQLDKRQIEKQLKHKTGGLFGSGELTGSIGVVTLNLPKLAFLSKDKNEFFNFLEHYAKIAKDSLEFKRKMVSNNFDKGMFPWTSRYLKQKFDTYFSTIGVIGGHEACLNLLGEGINTESGTKFCKEILEKLRNLMIEFQEETENMYNLEATPAEGTSFKLAKIDKMMYGDKIITSGNSDPYYTNSTQLPVDLTDDIFYALEQQNELQTLYTGGTVFHTFLGESVSNTESLKNFIIKAFTMTKIPYLSITPTFSICKNHGYINGEYFECPQCGCETEVYSRVVGYYRPIRRFNKGKKEEYKDRKMFDIEGDKKHA